MLSFPDHPLPERDSLTCTIYAWIEIHPSALNRTDSATGNNPVLRRKSVTASGLSGRRMIIPGQKRLYQFYRYLYQRFFCFPIKTFSSKHSLQNIPSKAFSSKTFPPKHSLPKHSLLKHSWKTATAKTEKQCPPDSRIF